MADGCLGRMEKNWSGMRLERREGGAARTLLVGLDGKDAIYKSGLEIRYHSWSGIICDFVLDKSLFGKARGDRLYNASVVAL